MCSRDDDPTQHDLPRIDWQASIDTALTDVRAMSEALVFARAEITRLKRIEDAAQDISVPTYVDEDQVIAHVPLYKLQALRAALRSAP